MAPFSTSPHWQAFDPRHARPALRKRSSAIPLGELRPELEGALGGEAQATPFECGRSSKTSFKKARARGLAGPSLTQRGVLVLDTAPALADLGQQHRDRLEDVEWARSRPSRNGLPYSSGTKRYGAGRSPSRRGPVDEPVEAEVRGLEDGPDRGTDRHVVREDAEVHDPVLPLPSARLPASRAPSSRIRRQRTRCAAPGCRLRPATHRGRVDDPDVAPCAWRPADSRSSPNAHHVAERGENDAGRLGHRYGVVDATHRDDAYRTTRPCTNSTDVGRRCSMP